MSSVEQWLSRLEDEGKSLKQGFERSATSMELFTRTATHSTSRNPITLTDQFGSYTHSDPERVIVTFNTNSGANTLAKLELSTNNPSMPVVRRLPFSGGARWSVTASTRDSSTWVPTNYSFTVHALIDGIITTSETSS